MARLELLDADTTGGAPGGSAPLLRRAESGRGRRPHAFERGVENAKRQGHSSVRRSRVGLGTPNGLEQFVSSS